MSSTKKNPSSGKGKISRAKYQDPKKTINPDKLVSDIKQQNEALNKIIKKFGEPEIKEGKPKILKDKGKFKNK